MAYLLQQLVQQGLVRNARQARECHRPNGRGRVRQGEEGKPFPHHRFRLLLILTEHRHGTKPDFRDLVEGGGEQDVDSLVAVRQPTDPVFGCPRQLRQFHAQRSLRQEPGELIIEGKMSSLSVDLREA